MQYLSSASDKDYLTLLTKNSSSSHIWAIFFPNRNCSEKVISWPAKPPKVRYQNEGSAIYVHNHRKIRFSLYVFEKKNVFNEVLTYKNFQNSHWLCSKLFLKPSNLIYRNDVFLKWWNIFHILHFNFWLWGTLEVNILTSCPWSAVLNNIKKYRNPIYTL